MDDDRTRKALDALADLFLTGVQPADKPQPVRHAATPTTTVLDGPTPFRLGPKLGTPTGSVHRSASDLDIVIPPRPAADQPLHHSRTAKPAFSEDPPPLRLHRPDEAESQPPLAPSSAAVALGHDLSDVLALPDEDSQQASAIIEAVILGNLPGLAGVWLTQYAQLLAREDGPVAIVHLAGDEVEVELVEGGNVLSPATDPSRPAARHPASGEGLIPLLETLLQRQNQPVRTLLLHVDPQNEQASACLQAIHWWTLLSGSDETAVVAAYQLLKELTHEDPNHATRRIGLMIMGSDAAKSDTAARRISAAARSFLHTPVEFVGWQQQMGPARVRPLGTFSGADAQWPVLLTWLNRVAQPAIEPVDPVDRPTARPSAAVAHAAGALASSQKAALELELSPDMLSFAQRQSSDAAVAPEFPPHVAHESPASTPTPIQPPRMQRAPSAVPPATVQPRESAEDAFSTLHPPASSATREAKRPPAAAEPVATQLPQTNEPDLAALIASGPKGVVGGIALEARCPHHPTIQLLLDQAGQLHLLARHQTAAASDHDLALTHLRAAIVDLLEADRWVREHLQLLQLTQRQCQFNPQAAPVLHLLTDRADLATALISRLGNKLRMHLLQSVTVGNQAAWFCTPLN